MRIRLTAYDTATAYTHDLVVSCHPDDPVDDVLAEIRSVFPNQEPAYLDGTPLPSGSPVADSALRDGAVLSFGRPLQVRATPGAQKLLRVLSGPSAGLEVAIPPGRVLTVGRDASCGLILADSDVSRMHLHAGAHGDAVQVVDQRSRNGLWVNEQRVTEALIADGQQFQIGGSRIESVRAESRVMVLARRADGTSLVNRQPRNPPRWLTPSLAFPTKAKPEEKRGLNLIALALPVVLAVVLALVTRQWYYLMIAGISPLTFLANNWSDRRRQKRKGAEQEAEYAGEMLALRRQVEAAVDAQDAYLRALWPDVGSVARAAVTPTVELWRRRPTDEDWLNIRLGTADLPADITFPQTRPQGWTDPVVIRAPVGVSLAHAQALGVAGPDDAVARTLRWALLQLAALHSPTELRLAVIAPDAGQSEFGWLRWLPHLSTLDGGVAAAWADDEIDALARSLRELVEGRRPRHAGAAETKPLPHYVVVLAGVGELYRRQAIAELIANGPAAGVYFLCVDSDPRLLPGRCRAVLEVGAATWLTVEGLGERRSLLADAVDAATVDEAARALAPLRVAGRAVAAGVPDQVRFAELVGLPDPDAVRAGWRRDGMDTRAVIGHDGDGGFVVDIVADGPHGLIAGTTRAGKSELLQTLLASLSINNSPLDLNFLFVDYKGGPTFQDLRPLPHIAATLTNLDEHLAERALSSLRAELVRRQQQLSDAGAKDLPHYRQLRAADPSLPPFPRLLIVVDEFAELKDFLPNVMDSLVGVARTGGSLGVHLLLATQRPGGGTVSGDIRANTSLRICLRVLDEEASRDVIDIPDAKQISADRPGRAYVLSGRMRPTLIQTARITTPNERARTPIEVRAVRWNESAVFAGAGSTAATQTDLQVLVESLRAAAQADDLKLPYPVVLPPLPGVVTLSELVSQNPASSVPDLLLGIRDRPAKQLQDILTLPLGSGHLGIVGSGLSGRSCALRAIAVGLAERFRPEEVHLHVLDAAAALAGLAALPHCGVYCRSDDEERVDRLLHRLHTELAARQELLVTYGAAGVNELPASVRPPHLVLLIDGYEAIVDQGMPRSDLVELMTVGASRGLTVVMAGDELMLRRLLSRFTYRLALSLNNPEDMGGLFRGPLPKGLPSGRGVWGEDGSTVQFPLLDKQTEGIAQNRALAATAARLSQQHPPGGDHFGKLRLEPLPGKVLLADAQAYGPAGKPGQVLVGVGGDVLACQWIELRDQPRLAVVGSARSGRSNAAMCMARTMAMNGGSVLMTGPRLHERHRELGRAGVKLLDADEAVTVSPGDFDLIVVDDADQFPAEAWLTSLAANRDQVLVFVTGWEAPLGNRPVPAFVKSAAVQVVLRPERTALRSGNNLGVAVPAETRFGGPAGRACVLVRGEARMAQVPWLGA